MPATNNAVLHESRGWCDDAFCYEQACLKAKDAKVDGNRKAERDALFDASLQAQLERAEAENQNLTAEVARLKSALVSESRLALQEDPVTKEDSPETFEYVGAGWEDTDDFLLFTLEDAQEFAERHDTTLLRRHRAGPWEAISE